MNTIKSAICVLSFIASNNMGPTVLCDGILIKKFNYFTGLLRL
jgi:hypothetical protein